MAPQPSCELALHGNCVKAPKRPYQCKGCLVVRNHAEAEGLRPGPSVKGGITFFRNGVHVETLVRGRLIKEQSKPASNPDEEAFWEDLGERAAAIVDYLTKPLQRWDELRTESTVTAADIEARIKARNAKLTPTPRPEATQRPNREIRLGKSTTDGRPVTLSLDVPRNVIIKAEQQGKQGLELLSRLAYESASQGYETHILTQAQPTWDSFAFANKLNLTIHDSGRSGDGVSMIKRTKTRISTMPPTKPVLILVDDLAPIEAWDGEVGMMDTAYQSFCELWASSPQSGVTLIALDKHADGLDWGRVGNPHAITTHEGGKYQITGLSTQGSSLDLNQPITFTLPK